MKYRLNYNYSLRNDTEGVYTLYNKATLKTYYISCKLYYILQYFYHQAISISFLEDEGKKFNVGLSDFYSFLDQEEFSDILIQDNSINQNIDYSLRIGELPLGTKMSPERVEFLITKHCNLSCKHCFEGSAPLIPTKSFTYTDMKRFVEQLEIAGIKTLKITGGEPFSHPNIDGLLELLVKIHFETMILTNALLLNDKRIETIKKGNIQLGISLDGISSSTHDFIRGKGCFVKLIKILEKLSRNNVVFSITCTVNKKNFSEINELIDFVFNKISANTLIISRLRPIGRAVDNFGLILNSAENDFIQKLCVEKGKTYGKRLILADDSTMKAKSSGNRIACSAGNSIFALDENFNVYPCVFAIGHLRYRIGNLLEEDICEIWKSHKWDALRGGTSIDDLKDCKDCRLKTFCVMKNCRFRPVFEGQTFIDAVSYCEAKSLSTAS